MTRQSRFLVAVLVVGNFLLFGLLVATTFLVRLTLGVQGTGMVDVGHSVEMDILYRSFDFLRQFTEDISVALLVTLGSACVFDSWRWRRSRVWMLDLAAVGIYGWHYGARLAHSEKIALPLAVSTAITLLCFWRLLLVPGPVSVAPALRARPKCRRAATLVGAVLLLLIPVGIAGAELIFKLLPSRVDLAGAPDPAAVALFCLGNAFISGLLWVAAVLLLLRGVRAVSEVFDSDRRRAGVLAVAAYASVPAILLVGLTAWAMPEVLWRFADDFGISALTVALLFTVGLGWTACTGWGLLGLRRSAGRPLHDLPRGQVLGTLLGYALCPPLSLLRVGVAGPTARFAGACRIAMLLLGVGIGIEIIRAMVFNLYERPMDILTQADPVFAIWMTLGVTATVACLLLLSRFWARIPAKAWAVPVALVFCASLSGAVYSAVIDRAEPGVRMVVRFYGPISTAQKRDVDRLLSPFQNDEVNDGKTYSFHGPDVFGAHPLSTRYRNDPPNVILICGDSARMDHLSAYGYSRQTTPNLDRFAAEADVVRFDNAFSPSDSTLCSVRSLFAGTFSSRGLRKPANAPLLIPDYLARIGYRKFAIDAEESHRFEMVASDFRNAEAAGDAKILAFGRRGNSDVSLADRFLETIDQLAPEDPGPIFGMVHFGSPHYPWNYESVGRRFGPADEAFEDLAAIDRFDHAVSIFDYAFQRVVDGLKKRGLYDNAIVIVYADHGVSLAEHVGRSGSLAGLWQEGVHIPLLIKVPGAQRSVVQAPASLVDVAPTLCDLLGVPVEQLSPFHGISLAPLILPDYRPPAKRPVVFVLRNYEDSYGLVAEGRWKFIFDRQNHLLMLYDLQADPEERNNLILVQSQRRERYKSMIDWFLREGQGSYAE